MNEQETLEQSLREAFAARAERTSVHAPRGVTDAPVMDLTEARRRRRVLVPVVSVAAAIALLVGVAVAMHDDNDGNRVGVGESSTEETTTPPTTLTTVDLLRALSSPMTFAGSAPVRYTLSGDTSTPYTNALVCEAGHVDAGAYVCTQVSGFLVSTNAEAYVATALGADATKTVAGPNPTHTEIGGHPAVISHFSDDAAMNAAQLPRVIQHDGPVVAVSWQVAPDVLVNVQATDRDDAAVATLLASLNTVEVAHGVLPLVLHRTDNGTITLFTEDGKVCYGISEMGTCPQVGDTDAAVGVPADAYTAQPFGWITANVDHVTVTSVTGDNITTRLSPPVDAAGHRIFVAESLAMTSADGNWPDLTITAYNADGAVVGTVTMPANPAPPSGATGVLGPDGVPLTNAG
jgi:hypothetical protein